MVPGTAATAVFLVAVLATGTGMAAGAPFVQGVSIDVRPDVGVADIAAVITSGSPVVSVLLSYSAEENATFGPPVPMTRTSADAVTGTYTFAYQLSWTLTSIRVMVVAEDSNGTFSDPFVTSQSWSVSSGTQSMTGGGPGAIAVAALVATATTAGIFGLRRFLRGRAP